MARHVSISKPFTDICHSEDLGDSVHVHSPKELPASIVGALISSNMEARLLEGIGRDRYPTPAIEPVGRIVSEDLAMHGC